MKKVLLVAAALAGCAEEAVVVPAPEPPEVVVQEEPPPPLDLSREHVAEMAGEADGLSDTPASLPDLFEGKDARRVKMRPGLITKEEAEGLKDSVDGVELKLEMQSR